MISDFQHKSDSWFRYTCSLCFKQCAFQDFQLRSKHVFIRYFRVVSRSMIARPGNKLISSGKRHNLRHASRALIRHTRHRRKGSKNHCVFWNTILNIGRCSKIGHRTLERRTVEKRGGNSDIVCIRPRGLKSFCVFYNVTMLSTNQTEKSH